MKGLKGEKHTRIREVLKNPGLRDNWVVRYKVRGKIAFTPFFSGVEYHNKRVNYGFLL